MHIVVLSRNARLYSTARLVEAIENDGPTPTVLDELSCDIIGKQEHPCVVFRGTEVAAIHALLPRLGSRLTFDGPPVNRQFEMLKRLSTLQPQSFVRSRHKLRSLQILARSRLG